MLRKPRKNSWREAIAIELAAACFFLLAGCDSNTAPAASHPPNASSVPTLAQEASERATLVLGTGNPSIDVAAVQAAVDHGGEVVLKGRFSFDAPATKPLAPALEVPGAALPPAAEVLIAKAVTISGPGDEQGGVTTINGGTIPFY